MTPANLNCIETSALSLWYGDFQALKDVSLGFPSKRISGLIGPSGCGKSTLLRCFNRINERYGNVTIEGEVKILNKNIYDSDVSLVRLRRQVGMVFQRPNPLPISIYDNIAFGLRLHEDPSKLTRSRVDTEVESALKEVGLWDELKDQLRVNAVSLQLEQQQKLCIARLLPLKPQVILMDEPCSSLDVNGTAAIEDLMLRLKTEYSIVIVTHNMAQARRISDSCAFMLLGSLVEQADTQELFNTPKDIRTENYIAGRYG